MALSAQRLLDGPGLKTLLQTNDFDAWEAVVGQTIDRMPAARCDLQLAYVPSGSPPKGFGNAAGEVG